MEKFTNLLVDISGGEASNDFIDIKANINNLKKIKFNFKNCNNFLGIDLSISKYKKIFSKLFIHLETEKNDFVCTIPSYRNDLYREVDLYEEVARVYGYDKIPSLQSCKIPYSVLIKDVKVFDVYQGDNIAAGKKSIAFNVILEPKDKTLSEKDIDQISKKIILAVQESTGATLRS